MPEVIRTSTTSATHSEHVVTTYASSNSTANTTSHLGLNMGLILVDLEPIQAGLDTVGLDTVDMPEPKQANLNWKGMSEKCANALLAVCKLAMWDWGGTLHNENRHTNTCEDVYPSTCPSYIGTGMCEQDSTVRESCCASCAKDGRLNRVLLSSGTANVSKLNISTTITSSNTSAMEVSTNATRTTTTTTSTISASRHLSIHVAITTSLT